MRSDPLLLLLLFSYVEEGRWDGFVWREHRDVFGMFQSMLPPVQGTFLAILNMPVENAYAEPMKVGVVLPLTGGLAEYAVAFKNGVEPAKKQHFPIAVKEISHGKPRAIK